MSSMPPPPILAGTVALHEVDLLSGQTIRVQGDEERDWFNDTRQDYMDNVRFTETTDLRDLDRLMVFELVVFRLSRWIASGQDYEGTLVDDDDLQKKIQRASSEITKIKQSMGLNKSARDAAENAGNFADWLANVRRRAVEFGVHRNNQVTKILSLFNELKTIIGTFDRSDAEEREKIGFTSEVDILNWIRETAIPEYDELDEVFRDKSQQYWVREM